MVKDTELLPKLEKYFSNRKDIAFAFLTGKLTRDKSRKNDSVEIFLCDKVIWFQVFKLTNECDRSTAGLITEPGW